MADQLMADHPPEVGTRDGVPGGALPEPAPPELAPLPPLVSAVAPQPGHEPAATNGPPTAPQGPSAAPASAPGDTPLSPQLPSGAGVASPQWRAAGGNGERAPRGGRSHEPARGAPLAHQEAPPPLAPVCPAARPNTPPPGRRKAAQPETSHGTPAAYLRPGHWSQGHLSQGHSSPSPLSPTRSSQGLPSQGHSSQSLLSQSLLAQGHPSQDHPPSHNHSSQGTSSQGHSSHNHSSQGHTSQTHSSQNHSSQGHMSPRRPPQEVAVVDHCCDLLLVLCDWLLDLWARLRTPAGDRALAWARQGSLQFADTCLLLAGALATWAALLWGKLRESPLAHRLAPAARQAAALGQSAAAACALALGALLTLIASGLRKLSSSPLKGRGPKDAAGAPRLVALRAKLRSLQASEVLALLSLVGVILLLPGWLLLGRAHPGSLNLDPGFASGAPGTAPGTSSSLAAATNPLSLWHPFDSLLPQRQAGTWGLAAAPARAQRSATGTLPPPACAALRPAVLAQWQWEFGWLRGERLPYADPAGTPSHPQALGHATGVPDTATALPGLSQSQGSGKSLEEGGTEDLMVGVAKQGGEAPLCLNGSDGAPVAMARLPPWVPAPERYLVGACHFGRTSNRLVCLQRALVMAALLNRTLILVQADVCKSRPQRRADEMPLLIDAPHLRRCVTPPLSLDQEVWALQSAVARLRQQEGALEAAQERVQVQQGALEVEQQRLEVAQQRLRLEQQRLEVEQQRLRVQEEQLRLKQQALIRSQDHHKGTETGTATETEEGAQMGMGEAWGLPAVAALDSTQQAPIQSQHHEKGTETKAGIEKKPETTETATEKGSHVGLGEAMGLPAASALDSAQGVGYQESYKGAEQGASTEESRGSHLEAAPVSTPGRLPDLPPLSLSPSLVPHPSHSQVSHSQGLQSQASPSSHTDSDPMRATVDAARDTAGVTRRRSPAKASPGLDTDSGVVQKGGRAEATATGAARRQGLVAGEGTGQAASKRHSSPTERRSGALLAAARPGTSHNTVGAGLAGAGAGAGAAVGPKPKRGTKVAPKELSAGVMPLVHRHQAGGNPVRGSLKGAVRVERRAADASPAAGGGDRKTATRERGGLSKRGKPPLKQGKPLRKGREHPLHPFLGLGPIKELPDEDEMFLTFGGVRRSEPRERGKAGNGVRAKARDDVKVKTRDGVRRSTKDDVRRSTRDDVRAKTGGGALTTARSGQRLRLGPRGGESGDRPGARKAADHGEGAGTEAGAGTGPGSVAGGGGAGSGDSDGATADAWEAALEGAGIGDTESGGRQEGGVPAVANGHTPEETSSGLATKASGTGLGLTDHEEAEAEADGETQGVSGTGAQKGAAGLRLQGKKKGVGMGGGGGARKGQQEKGGLGMEQGQVGEKKGVKQQGQLEARQKLLAKEQGQLEKKQRLLERRKGQLEKKQGQLGSKLEINLRLRQTEASTDSGGTTATRAGRGAGAGTGTDLSSDPGSGARPGTGTGTGMGTGAGEDMVIDALTSAGAGSGEGAGARRRLLQAPLERPVRPLVPRIVTLSEYLEAHSVSALTVDALFCDKPQQCPRPACRAAGEIEYPDPLEPPFRINRTMPEEDISILGEYTKDVRVLSLGDVFYGQAEHHRVEGDAPLAPMFGSQCNLLFQPVQEVFQGAAEFAALRGLRAPYAALHLRRTDFEKYCKGGLKCPYWSLAQIAHCMGEDLRESGIRQLLVATDAPAGEVNELRCQLAARGVELVHRPVHATSPLASALVEKVLSARAARFFFQKASSFSRHISQMRRGFGIGACHDQPICAGRPLGFVVPS